MASRSHRPVPPDYAASRRRRLRAGLIALLACLAYGAGPAAAPPAGAGCEADALACASLADRVGRACPIGCANRHCNSACLPPFDRGERCLECQANCARLCGHQAERRHVLCAAEQGRCEAAAGSEAGPAEPVAP